MTIHPIHDHEIETLRENIEALCMALAESSVGPEPIEEDFDAERDALELLTKVQER